MSCRQSKCPAAIHVKSLFIPEAADLHIPKTVGAFDHYFLGENFTLQNLRSIKGEDYPSQELSSLMLYKFDY